MIIEISGGRYEVLPLVRESVERQQLQHYALWDADCRNTEAWGITAWPVAYLIGRDGTVKWEGNPARLIARGDRLQNLIERELAAPSGDQ